MIANLIELIHAQVGTEEMAQWLRVFASLAEDLSLIPNIHVGGLTMACRYGFWECGLFQNLHTPKQI